MKTKDGPLWLTVPVLNKGRLTRTIDDMKINNVLPWKRKHWNSLCHCYGKAPYFKLYSDYFEDVYARDWKNLVELNESMLKWFLQTLGINTPVLGANEFNFSGKKSDLVLNMCQTLKANTFIFGALGQDYVDITAFEKADIKPVFQDYRHPLYPQLHGLFKSHLSIVDLIFNCGENSLDILMSDNLAHVELMNS